MTPNKFRELALSFPESIESAHMRIPIFVLAGKIFTTLGYPDAKSAMVKPTFRRPKGICPKWPGRFHAGERGVGSARFTSINLPAATTEIVREALIAAWRNNAPKRYRPNANAAPSSASAVHDLVRDFVARIAPDEDIVNLRFVL